MTKSVDKTDVLVLGAGGQLGRELVTAAESDQRLVALTRQELDIANTGAVRQRLASYSPQVVINAAAYTAVDAAEEDIRASDVANADGPAVLAQSCRAMGIRLIHVSTDFVFDGRASSPYATTAPTGPLGQYGRSKLAGENAVRSALAGALIVRSSWIYSRFGNNFVKTMLRLMAERNQLAVVDDQWGSPTWARDLARTLLLAASRPDVVGLYHWSDAGTCSWFEFAKAIAEEGLKLGLLQRPVEIKPIPSSEYPTAAKRPAYSVLDTSEIEQDLGVACLPWREQLVSMLTDLREHNYA
ncbi:MAG: dTDP-4-dehydrorhamnose reductase [Pseudomonadota bacterium]